MKTGDKIFLFGKDPVVPGMMISLPHHSDKNIMVRFIKHPVNENLYFNFEDFLRPYENPKYKEIILSMVPKKMKRLNMLWMNINAWQEIVVGIEKGKERDIIADWKERLLF